MICPAARPIPLFKRVRLPAIGLGDHPKMGPPIRQFLENLDRAVRRGGVKHEVLDPFALTLIDHVVDTAPDKFPAVEYRSNDRQPRRWTLVVARSGGQAPSIYFILIQKLPGHSRSRL